MGHRRTFIVARLCWGHSAPSCSVRRRLRPPPKRITAGIIAVLKKSGCTSRMDWSIFRARVFESRRRADDSTPTTPSGSLTMPGDRHLYRTADGENIWNPESHAGNGKCEPARWRHLRSANIGYVRIRSRRRRSRLSGCAAEEDPRPSAGSWIFATAAASNGLHWPASDRSLATGPPLFIDALSRRRRGGYTGGRAWLADETVTRLRRHIVCASRAPGWRC